MKGFLIEACFSPSVFIKERLNVVSLRLTINSRIASRYNLLSKTYQRSKNRENGPLIILVLPGMNRSDLLDLEHRRLEAKRKRNIA